MLSSSRITRCSVGIGQHALRLVPGGARRSDVALAILGLPGETLAHHLDVHQLGKARQEKPLAGLAPAFHELHDAQPQAVAQAPHRQAPGGRALALAGAGVDDQQALLLGLRGVDPILDGLDPGHLLAVRLVDLGVGPGLGGHGELPVAAARLIPCAAAVNVATRVANFPQ